MNRLTHFALALSLFGSTWIGPAYAAGLKISEAWVREAPPTSVVNAAYMQINNPGGSDLAIIGASSPQFETVEIHRTEISDGMARMIPQERLVVPAKGHVGLEPNGLHLMLIQAKQPLPAGASVEINLQIDNGETLKLEAAVRPALDQDMPAGMDHSHHQHH